VYFPETAVAAMIDTVEDRGTVEVGIIGHEGMVGISIFLGFLVLGSLAASARSVRVSASEARRSIRR
jgi:hypothetical protein